MSVPRSMVRIRSGRFSSVRDDGDVVVPAYPVISGSYWVGMSLDDTGDTFRLDGTGQHIVGVS